MYALAVPALSIGAALGAGGLAKLRQPDAAAPLLSAARLPAGRIAGAVLGLTELALATAAVLVGGTAVYAVVAAAFTGFGAVLLLVLRRGGAPSCGCFGRRSAPPHPVHVGVDAAAATVAAAAAATGTPGLLNGLLDGAGGLTAPLVAMGALGGVLVVAALTVLPEVLTTARQHDAAAPTPFHLLPPRETA